MIQSFLKGNQKILKTLRQRSEIFRKCLNSSPNLCNSLKILRNSPENCQKLCSKCSKMFWGICDENCSKFLRKIFGNCLKVSKNIVRKFLDFGNLLKMIGKFEKIVFFIYIFGINRKHHLTLFCLSFFGVPGPGDGGGGGGGGASKHRPLYKSESIDV